MIHELAQVKTSQIGKNTVIWQYSVILEGAIIGDDCNINCHTFIENDVIIGNNVTIKSGNYLWDGLRLEDDVFIGPNVVFTNDIFPRSKKRIKFLKTVIKKGASLGANSTVLAGITIGKYAMSGIASVITRNIPDYALVFGNPAIFKSWIDEKGNKLIKIDENTFKSISGDIYIKSENGLKKEL